MTSPNRPAPDFTVDTTRPVLHRACRVAGVDSAEVRVLRHHSNAVYVAGSQRDRVVVKIARPGPDPEQDLRDARSLVGLTRWLTDSRVPTTTLVDTVDQPLHVDGFVVTLWHYLPQQRPMTTRAIAAPLLALHQAPLPPISRPRLDPIGAITRSITDGRVLTAEHRAVLRDRLDRLTAAWTDLCSTAPVRLIHTDPQHRNTLWRHPDTAAGQSAAHAGDDVVLCDLDDVTTGPVEWDLVTIEIHARRFGHPDHDAFCQAYGRDIHDWPGYADLRELRELRMISTNARKSQPGSPQAAEVLRRIDTLDDAADQPWLIL